MLSGEKKNLHLRSSHSYITFVSIVPVGFHTLQSELVLLLLLFILFIHSFIEIP
jgi:hypothetical protein